MANNTNADPIKDRRGCWKRGMIVAVLPDGAAWGGDHPSLNAAPRKFALLRFPGVSVARISKYMAEQFDDAGGTLPVPERFRRRLWQIQHAELPQVARDIIAQTGMLTIGPEGDFTWAQVRNFFQRLDDNTRETEAL